MADFKTYYNDQVFHTPRPMGVAQIILMAIGGLVLFTLIMGATVSVGGFFFMRSETVDNKEQSAIRSLQEVAAAQRQYYARHYSYGSFEQLYAARLLDDSHFNSTAPSVNGYTFKLSLTADMYGDYQTFAVRAEPEEGSFTSPPGSRHFYVGSDNSNPYEVTSDGVKIRPVRLPEDERPVRYKPRYR